MPTTHGLVLDSLMTSNLGIQHEAQPAGLRVKRTSSRPRSCDTCFKLKERCTWTNNTEACDRCRRIFKPCTTHRIPKPMGRRPRRVLTADANGTTSGLLPSLQSHGAIFSKLDTFERAAVDRFFQPEFFSSLMLVPRQGLAMHEQAICVVLQHWDETRDACISMIGAYATAQSATIPGYAFESNAARGTRALNVFVKMDVTQHNLQLWLWLGIAIFIYAHCELASSASAIRRYLLSRLREACAQSNDLASHPTITSLIALDIYESLLYRRRPIMNMPSICAVGSNTFLGLCAPLLRRAFDLAQLKGSCRHQKIDSTSLTQLQACIESWQPVFPPGWSDGLSTMETIHILSQVRVHKTMLLLFLHRLKYVFGEEDAAAAFMADSIMAELCLAMASTGQAPIWVMTPFIIAAIEVTNVKERARAIEDASTYGDKISPQSQYLTREFLDAVWTLRDKKEAFRWIDRMDEFPRLCLYA